MGTGGMDPATFERLFPSRFISFSFPNPLPSPGNPFAVNLRVAVADSPSIAGNFITPTIAAVLVPLRREDDWIFSTVSGHFQLLFSLSSPNHRISRLILIGDPPSSFSSLPQPYRRRPQANDDAESLISFQEGLAPLLLALCPKSVFSSGIPSIPFLSYEDDVISCTPVAKLFGPFAGEMVVEDVEIDLSPASPPELRRRLRFKKMPNLIQSQVRLLSEFCPEMGSLVQPYLGLMVSALFLIAPAIDGAFRSGNMPRVLCVGVGGGPLLTSLRSHLGFRVLGVESDDVVLSAARMYFGLVDGESLKVLVDDGIKFIEDYALKRSESELFHAIMVDLDEVDPMNGVGAPPAEFLRMDVLTGARMALLPEGILVVNVVPLNDSLYAKMIELFRMVFCDLYELKVDDGENFVIVATSSPIGSIARQVKNKKGSFYGKLQRLNCHRFIDGIKKI